MLKYLFTAVYKDGTVFKQNENDVSYIDPQRSAYYDINQDELAAFGIESEKDAIVVDLQDGSFQINGVAFQAHDQLVDNRRLIFFRRHTHQFNTELDEIDHAVEYCIGWQGNDPNTGSNIQRVLYIK